MVRLDEHRARDVLATEVELVHVIRLPHQEASVALGDEDVAHAGPADATERHEVDRVAGISGPGTGDFTNGANHR